MASPYAPTRRIENTIHGVLNQLSKWVSQDLSPTASPTFNGLTINGDLVALGNVTSLSSSITEFKDNVLLINANESLDGVALRYAGIEVDRGTLPNQRLVWSEDTLDWHIDTGALLSRDIVTVDQGLFIWDARKRNAVSTTTLVSPLHFEGHTTHDSLSIDTFSGDLRWNNSLGLTPLTSTTLGVVAQSLQLQTGTTLSWSGTECSLVPTSNDTLTLSSGATLQTRTLQTSILRSSTQLELLAPTILIHNTVLHPRVIEGRDGIGIDDLSITNALKVGNTVIIADTLGARITGHLSASSLSINDGFIGSLRFLSDTATDAYVFSSLGSGTHTFNAPVTFNADGDLQSNWTFTNLRTPINPGDAVNKRYVDAIAQGIDVKDSVRVSTTSSITLSGLQIIDGVSLDVGDRVLVRFQDDAVDNGLYVADTGDWVRTSDAADGAVLSGAFVFIESGDTMALRGFVQTTERSVVGESIQTWTQFTSLGQTVAGPGLIKKNNTELEVQTDTTLQIVNDYVGIGQVAGTGLGGGNGDVLYTSSDQSHVTRVGTITDGAWEGTAVGPAYGGTGSTSFTHRALIVGMSGNTGLASSTSLFAPDSGGIMIGGTTLTGSGGSLIVDGPISTNVIRPRTGTGIAIGAGRLVLVDVLDFGGMLTFKPDDATLVVEPSKYLQIGTSMTLRDNDMYVIDTPFSITSAQGLLYTNPQEFKTGLRNGTFFGISYVGPAFRAVLVADGHTLILQRSSSGSFIQTESVGGLALSLYSDNTLCVTIPQDTVASIVITGVPHPPIVRTLTDVPMFMLLYDTTQPNLANHERPLVSELTVFTQLHTSSLVPLSGTDTISLDSHVYASESLTVGNDMLVTGATALIGECVVGSDAIILHPTSGITLNSSLNVNGTSVITHGTYSWTATPTSYVFSHTSTSKELVRYTDVETLLEASTLRFKTTSATAVISSTSGLMRLGGTQTYVGINQTQDIITLKADTTVLQSVGATDITVTDTIDTDKLNVIGHSTLGSLRVQRSTILEGDLTVQGGITVASSNIAWVPVITFGQNATSISHYGGTIHDGSSADVQFIVSYTNTDDLTIFRFENPFNIATFTTSYQIHIQCHGYSESDDETESTFLFNTTARCIVSTPYVEVQFQPDEPDFVAVVHISLRRST